MDLYVFANFEHVEGNTANANNLCPWNSLLQCLRNCSQFWNTNSTFCNLETTPITPVLIEMKRLILSKKKKENLAILRKCVAEHLNKPTLANGSQQDIGEVYNALIIAIKNEMEWLEIPDIGNLTQLFTLTETTQLRFLNGDNGACPKCKKMPDDSTFDHHISMKVHLKKTETNLQNLIDAEYMTSFEDDPRKCSFCGDNSRNWNISTHRILIKTPEVLVIQLVRFMITHHVTKKDTSFIKVPFQITIQNQHYDLDAVANHNGSISGGHYTAIVKKGQKWYHFNDARNPVLVRPDQVNSNLNYILWYKKNIHSPQPVTEETHFISESSNSNLPRRADNSIAHQTAKFEMSSSKSNQLNPKPYHTPYQSVSHFIEKSDNCCLGCNKDPNQVRQDTEPSSSPSSILQKDFDNCCLGCNKDPYQVRQDTEASSNGSTILQKDIDNSCLGCNKDPKQVQQDTEPSSSASSILQKDIDNCCLGKNKDPKKVQQDTEPSSSASSIVQKDIDNCCLGCNKKFQRLFRHVNLSSHCQTNYNMQKLKELYIKRNLERKRNNEKTRRKNKVAGNKEKTRRKKPRKKTRNLERKRNKEKTRRKNKLADSKEKTRRKNKLADSKEKTRRKNKHAENRVATRTEEAGRKYKSHKRSLDQDPVGTRTKTAKRRKTSNDKSLAKDQLGTKAKDADNCCLGCNKDPNKVQQDTEPSSSASSILQKDIDNSCLGCNKNFQRLFRHVNLSSHCQTNYNMQKLKELYIKRNLERKRNNEKTRRKNKLAENRVARRTEEAGRKYKSHKRSLDQDPVATRTKAAKRQKISHDKSLAKDWLGTKAKDAVKTKKHYQVTVQLNPINAQEHKAISTTKKKAHSKQLNETEYDRIKQFRESVRDGPIYTCICCRRIRFHNQVVKWNIELINRIAKPELIKDVIGTPPKDLLVKGSHHICHNCATKLKEHKYPAMRHDNQLQLVNLDDKPELREITELENALIARNLVFQMLFQLPKSRWTATKKPIVNIPIIEDDIVKTMQSLPRTPQEAGIVQVKLKRKQSLKNSHLEQYIDVNRMKKALQTLQQCGNKHYQFIPDWDDFNIRMQEQDCDECGSVTSDNEDTIDSSSDNSINSQQEQVDQEDDEQEWMKEDPVQKYHFDVQRPTLFLHDYPEVEVNKDLTAIPEESNNSSQVPNTNEAIVLAPGENKTPTNILQEKDWEVKSYPALLPDGRNGYFEKRSPQLSLQQYFQQRILNKDRRFANCPGYVFAAFAANEKSSLERNINISFMRGKQTETPEGNTKYTLNNPYSVLDNSPGTPRYWQKKKFELISRLENLGPFQIFFTLSCPEKRMNENFTVFLQDHNISYEVERGQEQCYIDNMKLDDFLQLEENQSKHDFIKQNILTATLNFDHRVQQFIKYIMMNHSSPLRIKYYNYRVEFQRRGAPHIHGTLWVDWPKLIENIWASKGKKTTNNVKGNSKAAKEKRMEIEQQINEEVHKYNEIFNKIRTEELGLISDQNEQQQHEMMQKLSEFSNWCVSCSLKDPSTRELVSELNRHKHFQKSCRKRGSKCRFHFPRLPSLRTIISVPARIKYGQDDNLRSKKLEEAKEIKQKVTKVLENEEFMEETSSQPEELNIINQFLTEQHIIQAASTITESYNPDADNHIHIVDDKLLEHYVARFSLLHHKDIRENMLKLIDEFSSKVKNTACLIDKIEKQRLLRILHAAKISENDTSDDQLIQMYEEALSLSTKGYEVILKRDIVEIYINNYNSEWIKAWNGNIDVQIALDYYAIITYITDYYMKDESGTLEFIRKALAENPDENLRQAMRRVQNAFLTNRQAGECEVYYKLFPFLHLTDSNITTTFAPTGFKRNRSRFLKQISKEMAQNMDKVIQVQGKEDRYYIEKESALDKYQRRHTDLDSLSYSQFVQRYEPCSEKTVPKHYQMKYKCQTDSNFDKSSSRQINIETSLPAMIKKMSNPHPDDLKNTDNYIYTSDKKSDKLLPMYFPLLESEGKTQWMRRRSRKVIRFHKFKKDTEPHEFYYSELQLYFPFRDESQLYPDSALQCQKFYIDNIESITAVKKQVMPHLDTVTAARTSALEFMSNVGVDLDPNKEQEDDEAREDGEIEHPQLNIKDPTELLNSEITSNTDRTFRRIELQSDEELYAKARTLDKDQRAVLNKGLEFARKYQRAKKHDNPWPKPPLLLVHGGAGTGKSHVIDVLSQMLEKEFRTSGDNPNHPYILRLAFTGNAASVINGQTIHSAFQLPFNNSHVSLQDKTRDLRRKQLQNLRLIIIDEISLVKSDMLYQIHFRLSKDIFQNNLPFGGVSVITFGDILQIKPPQGTLAFAEPVNEKSKMLYSIDNLWEKFEVITLKTNHRQGEDGQYADLLNRLRIGQQTNEDIQLLKTRVFPRDSPDLPNNTLLISGTNKIVCQVNESKLNDMRGELLEFKAQVQSSTRGEFKPSCDSSGMVKNTPIPANLRLKIGAKIMLTYNLDVCDSLTNGALGQIVGFKRNTFNRVQYIMVKFDNEQSGKNRRKTLNFDYEFPGATPIEIVEFEFTIKKNTSATATATNFPLKLAFATTAHKIQGHTIKKPQKVLLDLDCWLQPAMVYVMLSRVQCLKQLYILKTLNEDKIKPWPNAIAELQRLNSIDISKPIEPLPFAIEIATHNTRSIRTHINDIRADHTLISADIICLQEIWNLDTQKYDINDKQCHFNTRRRGNGVATYFPASFKLISVINEDRYQITAIASKDLIIINIYRSKNAGQDFIYKLQECFANETRSILICGDFNFCQKSEPKHSVKILLDKNNFTPALYPPEATHMDGRCLDQAYYRLTPDLTFESAVVKVCYYSDHEPIIVTLKHTNSDD